MHYDKAQSEWIGGHKMDSSDQVGAATRPSSAVGFGMLGGIVGDRFQYGFAGISAELQWPSRAIHGQ